jgi:hypothetical protein
LSCVLDSFFFCFVLILDSINLSKET